MGLSTKMCRPKKPKNLKLTFFSHLELFFILSFPSLPFVMKHTLKHWTLLCKKYKYVQVVCKKYKYVQVVCNYARKLKAFTCEKSPLFGAKIGRIGLGFNLKPSNQQSRVYKVLKREKMQPIVFALIFHACVWILT